MSTPHWIREWRPLSAKPLPWHEQAQKKPSEAAESPHAPVRDEKEARIEELEQLLAQARARSEQLEREAFEKAFQAGEKAGLEVGKKRAEQMLAEMDEVRSALEAEAARVRDVLAEAGWEVLEAVLAHVLGEAFADARALRALVDRALAEWPFAEDLILFAPPEFEAAAKALVEEHPLLAHVRVDPALRAPALRIAGKEGDLWLDPAEAARRFVRRMREGIRAVSERG